MPRAKAWVACGAVTKAGTPCKRSATRRTRSGRPACSLHLEPGRASWPRFRWPASRLETLYRLMEQGRPDAEIAAEMGTTEAAVQMAVRHWHLPSRQRLCLTARQVARLVGAKCAKSVARWVEAGWLVGRRGWVQGPHAVWLVRWADLEAFLRDPAHWHRWEPARVTHPELRRVVAETRAGEPRLLTQTEAARICGVQRGTVQQWLDRGWLPAARGRRNRMVAEADLAAFRARWSYGDGLREAA